MWLRVALRLFGHYRDKLLGSLPRTALENLMYQAAQGHWVGRVVVSVASAVLLFYLPEKSLTDTVNGSVSSWLSALVVKQSEVESIYSEFM